MRGTFTSAARPYFFGARRVEGTPWRIIAAVPTSALYAPVEEGRWIPWLVLTGFGLALIAAMYLFLRNSEARRELRAAYAQLESTSRIDPLTTTFTRRHAEEHLTAAATRAERHGDAGAVVMVDIDRFKSINDTYGHATGDQVLAEVAARVQRTLRTSDALGRWGGEEFVVVAERISPDGAGALAERLRAVIAENPIVVGGTRLNVTASLGVACTTDGRGFRDLVDAADAAMYEAKRGGRNRVVTVPTMQSDESRSGRG